jgi:hypothetical protein
VEIRSRVVAWRLAEAWSVEIRSRVVAWRLAEAWSVEIKAPAEWRLAEAWSVKIKSRAVAWRLAEAWTGEIGSRIAWWRPTESWRGVSRAPLQWRMMESWSVTPRSRPVGWRLVSLWTSITRAPVEWYAAEFLTGIARAPVPSPLLLFPPDTLNDNDNTPTLVWENLQAADNFWLQVDNDSSFASPVLDVVLTGNSYTFPAPLADNLYHWRVKMFRDGTSSDWSEVWRFRVDTLLPAAPTLLLPLVGADLNTSTPFLDWSPVDENSHPVLYQVWISNFPDFSDVVWLSEWLTSDNCTTPWLADTENYYHWKARARDNAGNAGLWSTARHFRVDTLPPIAPTLLLPENAGWADGTPTLSWTAIPENSLPVEYYVEVSETPDFLTLAFTSGWIEDNLWDMPPLPHASTWYWRVRARDRAGNESEEWSLVFSFSVDAQAPSQTQLLSPAHGAILPVLTVEFKYTALDNGSGIARYWLRIDDEPTLTTPFVHENFSIPENTYTYTLPVGKYYWKVCAIDGVGYYGDWSVIFEFVLGPAPTLFTPENGSNTNDATPTFDWSFLLPYDNFQIQVSDSLDFYTLILDATSTIDKYTPPAALPDGLLYWRVRAWKDNEPYAWSEPWCFRLDTQAPAAPINARVEPEGWTRFNFFEIFWTNPPDPTGISGVYYKLGVVPTSPLDGTYVAGADITSFGLSLPSEGEHAIHLWLRDGVGNADHNNRVTLTLRLDMTIDSPTNLTATPSGWSGTDSFALTWINPSDISSIVGAFYKLDTPPTSENDGVFVPGMWIAFISNISVLEDGAHTIYLWLKDGAGNIGYEEYASTTLSLDTTAPIIEIVGGWNQTTAEPSMEVEGSITDISEVVLFINDELTPVTNGTFKKTIQLALGLNEIEFTAIDSAGNTTSATLIVERIFPVTITTLPLLTPARAGETTVAKLVIRNLGQSLLTNLRAVLSAAPGWVTVEPGVFSLEGGESLELEISATPPATAEARDYTFTINLWVEDMRTRSELTLRVVEPLKIAVARGVALDLLENTTEITIRLWNGERSVRLIELIDEIPRALADDLQAIEFITPPTELVENAMLVRWIFEDLIPLEERTVSYVAKRILPDYSAYLRWFLKEFKVFHEIPAEFIQLVELQPPVLIAGEADVLKLRLKNVYTKTLSFTVDLSLPAGWSHEPSKPHITLAPGSIYELNFMIYCPADVAPRVYAGEVRVAHEAGFFTRSFSVPVKSRPPSPIGVLLPLFPWMAGIALFFFLTFAGLPWLMRVLAPARVAAVMRAVRERLPRVRRVRPMKIAPLRRVPVKRVELRELLEVSVESPIIRAYREELRRLLEEEAKRRGKRVERDGGWQTKPSRKTLGRDPPIIHAYKRELIRMLAIPQREEKN